MCAHLSVCLSYFIYNFSIDLHVREVYTGLPFIPLRLNALNCCCRVSQASLRKPQRFTWRLWLGGVQWPTLLPGDFGSVAPVLTNAATWTR